jgi:hypothetical protein
VSAQTEIRLPEVDLGHGRSAGESDYVEFWLAGATAIGTFCCAACGRAVRSVNKLPDCLSCGGSVWEQPSSSPFATAGADVVATEEAWFEDEARSVAGLTRGFALALVLAPISWLVPLLAIYALIRL